MLAAAKMQNMTIQILTTGVSNSLNCKRCPPNTFFQSQGELLEHEENVHRRSETEEEKEGRLQGSRWTTLKVSENEQKAKTPDLYLMHEDDVHYSLMVHKDHNLLKYLSDP